MSERNLAANRSGPRVVGVIMSGADLDFAIRMRKPPDFFELRLDRLARIVDELENKLPNLRAPLIITARHPQEGGANKLSIRQRRNLLSRFLHRASYLDVELRSASALGALLKLARRKNVRRIISFHNADLYELTPMQLARLLDFMKTENVDLPLSAMGIGKLGAISRVLLARCGSVLVYASVAAATDIEGQMSLEQLRALGIGVS